MALIIEDGTGKTDSNTYVSEATFADWLVARGLSITTASDTLLLQAADYMETLRYVGYKLTSTQAMQFPRGNVYIDNYLIDSDIIPRELLTAQMYLAYAIDQGYNPMSTVGRAVKREKVDVLEVEYMDNASATESIRSFNNIISKLLVSSGRSFSASLRV